MGLIGYLFFIAVAVLLSNNRKCISKRVFLSGILLQVTFALLVIGVPRLGFLGPLRFIFNAANEAILAILKFTEAGSRFVFGDLVDVNRFGFIVAFQVLPTIIFMSTLMAVLYHLGIMQKIIGFLAWIMERAMGISGAESLSTAANIFVGQTEAPLLIKPFLARMTKSELYTVMVGGMATVAGGVLAAYVGFLKARIPDIAGHLLAASVLSAPATILLSKIIYPETEMPQTLGQVPAEYTTVKTDTNVIEATARGASEGLQLAMNVAAMLLAFIAMIALLDGVLGVFGGLIGFNSWGQELVPLVLKKSEGVTPLSFAIVMGWLFAPISWLMGVPWSEAPVAGALLGQKIVLNEFVAYSTLSQIMLELSDKTVLILSYALCGFANFLSIGIQLGGIGAMVPERRADLATLGIKALIAGAMCTCMTASLVSVLS
jgi:CNT family concentrative nucleoside transporter